MAKVVALVPIKLNNERLPNKNIKSFDNGKPLCQYILNTLQQVEGIDEIYVFCSNPSIQNYLPEKIKFLQRDTSLDSNTTKINEVILAFAKQVPADIYVLSHATAPFITTDSISKGLKAVLSKHYDSALSVKRIQGFLWDNGAPYNYDLNNIPRTQDINPIYEETCGFYIYDYDTIVNKNRRIGSKPYIVEIGQIESIDIDEKEDFEIANAIFNHIINH